MSLLGGGYQSLTDNLLFPITEDATALIQGEKQVQQEYSAVLMQLEGDCSRQSHTQGCKAEVYGLCLIQRSEIGWIFPTSNGIHLSLPLHDPPSGM